MAPPVHYAPLPVILDGGSIPALPLPTGAASEATQSQVYTQLTALSTAIATLNSAVSTLLGKHSASTSTISVSTTIPVNPNSVQIVAANANRKGLIIYNNSANSIYVAFAATANSANNLTVIVPTFTSYIMQFPIYTGVLAATRNSGSGSAIVTELT